MKILYIEFIRQSNTTRLHLNFIKKLSEHCEFYVYGPGCGSLNDKKLAPIPFTKDITFKELYNIFKFDLLLLPEYSIANTLCTTIKNIKSLNVFKASVEADYYRGRDNKDWYLENGINLILNRGVYADEDFSVPHVWLPFSASNEFYTDENSDYFSNRINKIAYVGDTRYSRNKYYKSRQKAVRLLEDRDLIDYLGNLKAKQYVEVLKTYKYILSCSFLGVNTAPAKTFEIMASGAALLTTWFRQEDKLFFGQAVPWKYSEDCSDLLSVVKSMMLEESETNARIKKGLYIINNHHLHKHRILELYNILLALVENRTIPMIWGV